MNGTQQQQNPKDATAQKPLPDLAATAASANGSSALNKKRKKDGLKPIITTEGPGYVHHTFHSSAFIDGQFPSSALKIVFGRVVERRRLHQRCCKHNTQFPGCAVWAGGSSMEGKAPVPMRSHCDITQRGAHGDWLPRWFDSHCSPSVQDLMTGDGAAIIFVVLFLALVSLGCSILHRRTILRHASPLLPLSASSRPQDIWVCKGELAAVVLSFF
jgi:hypothetical protein